MAKTNMNMSTSLYLVNGTDYAVILSDAHNYPVWNMSLNTCRLS